MKMYVGITDHDWFKLLRQEKCDEVNFWTPGSTPFKALQMNDLFLFKLHHPHNYIVGGGYFVRFSILPTFLAWQAFGIKNGTKSIDELNKRIKKYRGKNGIVESNPQIGCIILTEPFFFEESDWIPVPEDWSMNIVRGKTYSTDTAVGLRLFEDVQDRLPGNSFEGITASQRMERYAMSLSKHRLGQGAFRVSVADAYKRRCAITGEKTLPVLQAAHSKPYSQEGPHEVNNGLFLRSDVHTLFDDGYITIDKDYRIYVSRHLHEDYGNGKDYYKYHGQKLLIVPDSFREKPARLYLQWHNENVFRG